MGKLHSRLPGRSYGKGFGLDIGAARAEAAERHRRSSTSVPPTLDLKTANFSGGNQQKIVLAREMERDPDVLVVGQPTRGVDIGAIEFIHNQIIKMRDAGKAILLVSVELDEIRSLSDRILVMFDGQIVGEADPATADEGELGLLMTGVASGNAPAEPARHAARTRDAGAADAGRDEPQTIRPRMPTDARRLPRWVDVALLPLLNVVLAFLDRRPHRPGGRPEPAQAVGIMLYGAFGYGSGFGYTLYYTTDFIFAGLAVSLAYHAGLFNIGPEGQAYVGGLGVILVALALNGMHWALVFPLMIIVGGALFGAFWAFIPGYLQAKRGSHVVITTILFNFIAVVGDGLHDLAHPEARRRQFRRERADRCRSPACRSSRSSSACSSTRRSTSPSSSPLLALVFVYWLIWHTKFGFAMRALGHNPTAANYAGISNEKMIMIVMAMSGALAGMVAVNNVGGVQGRLILNFVNGAGFVGIAVAFMGKGHPVGVALSALLFGALYQGGQELAFSMPGITREMIVTIQALVILFTGAMGDMLRDPAARICSRAAPPAGGTVMDSSSSTSPSILDSTVRLAVPLLLACLAGLYSERAGIVDIGLEGKLLASAFGAAAVVGRHRLGLARSPRRHRRGAAVLGHPRPRLDQPQGQPDHLRRGAQFPRRRPHHLLGQSWFHRGGYTPSSAGDQRFSPHHAALRRRAHGRARSSARSIRS